MDELAKPTIERRTDERRTVERRLSLREERRGSKIRKAKRVIWDFISRKLVAELVASPTD